MKANGTRKAARTKFVRVDVTVLGDVVDVQAFITNVTKSLGNVCLYRNPEGCRVPMLRQDICVKGNGNRHEEGEIDVQQSWHYWLG